MFDEDDSEYGDSLDSLDSESPIQIGQNDTVIVPGIDRPVPASELIGTQSRFTQRMQELAERERQLEALGVDAQYGLQLLQAFREDPESVASQLMEEASKMTGKQITPSTSAAEPAMTSSEVAELKAQLEEMKSTLFGYMARNQVDGELESLRKRDPKLTDPESVSRVVRRAQAAGINSLTDAYKIEFFDDLMADLEKSKAEAKDAYKKALLPNFGVGTSAGEAMKPAESPEQALRRILEKNLSKQLSGS